jgi:hypothetical protein
MQINCFSRRQRSIYRERVVDVFGWLMRLHFKGDFHLKVTYFH